MLASELILDAYYLAGILDPDEQVAGYYLDLGLRTLNNMISSWSSSSSYITFFNTIEVPLQANKWQYFVSKLPGDDVDSHPITEVVNAHVNLSGVKYPLKEVFTTIDNFDNYDLVQGIPSSVYLYQKEARTELRFYPAPSQTMTASMLCKSRYPLLLPFESIVSIADRAKEAIIYALGQRLANVFQFITTSDFKKTHDEVLEAFRAANIKDDPANGDSISATGYNAVYYPYWGG